MSYWWYWFLTFSRSAGVKRRTPDVPLYADHPVSFIQVCVVTLLVFLIAVFAVDCSIFHFIWVLIGHCVCAACICVRSSIWKVEVFTPYPSGHMFFTCNCCISFKASSVGSLKCKDFKESSKCWKPDWKLYCWMFVDIYLFVRVFSGNATYVLLIKAKLSPIYICENDWRTTGCSWDVNFKT